MPKNETVLACSFYVNFLKLVLTTQASHLWHLKTNLLHCGGYCFGKQTGGPHFMTSSIFFLWVFRCCLENSSILMYLTGRRVLPNGHGWNSSSTIYMQQMHNICHTCVCMCEYINIFRLFFWNWSCCYYEFVPSPTVFTCTH